MKNWTVRVLLHLYPTEWRREYGPELAYILLGRPMTAGIVINILLNGLRQRILVTEPSTFLGLGLMALAASRLAQDQLILSPQTSNLYVLLLIGCGLWTHLRYGGEVSRSGRAAVKLALIAGLPVMLAGLLMLFGILELHPSQDYCAWRVSDSSLGLPRQIQIAICPPAPMGVLAAPLLALGTCWLWGMLGGFLGRWILRRRRSVSA